jgi:calcineurin-like phosphoesterase family protein
MDDVLIKNWNSVVGPKDHVYHNGDFSLHKGSGYALRTLQQLNGRIYLIKGNHDTRMFKGSFRDEVISRFEWIKDYFELPVQGVNTNKNKIVLCHYPFQTWNKSHRGAWHLHGHCHGGLPSPGIKRLDVGVDSVASILNRGADGYRPISLGEVAEIMENK